jgi:hypothetical protein
VAGFLAWDYGAMRGINAVANGWLQRARRLIEDLEPSGEHAWLPLIEASFHLDTDPGAVHHVSGRLAIRMDDGTEFVAGPGDITSLPSGHDAWVVGNEPAVVVDWYGASNCANAGGGS